MVISVLAAETLRQIAQRRIDDLPDWPQRMVAPHPSFTKLNKEPDRASRTSDFSTARQ